jgi:hypothetical protein
MRCYGADKNVALQIKIWVILLIVFLEIPVSSAIFMASISRANSLIICLILASEILERFLYLLLIMG